MTNLLPLATEKKVASCTLCYRGRSATDPERRRPEPRPEMWLMLDQRFKSVVSFSSASTRKQRASC